MLQDRDVLECFVLLRMGWSSVCRIDQNPIITWHISEKELNRKSQRNRQNLKQVFRSNLKKKVKFSSCGDVNVKTVICIIRFGKDFFYGFYI